MNTARKWVFSVLALLALQLVQNTAQAVVNDCDNTHALEHSFSSGATWSICVAINDQHVLDVTAVHYRAPGDTMRSVLQRVHVGQILVHYHDEAKPRAQIGIQDAGKIVRLGPGFCNGTQLLDSGDGPLLCSRVKDNRTQAKFARRPSVQSQRWELSSAFQYDNLIWTTSISFDEDGRITPSVSLSGRARNTDSQDVFGSSLSSIDARLVRSTILATWRMVFNLDDGGYDTVQQFDFPLNEENGNRRAMQVKNLDVESFVKVDRENFRGWRVVDPAGAGFLLDPYNSGFSFKNREYRWPEYDLSLTRFKPCEQYALLNQGNVSPATDCGESLDDFVDGEVLHDTHPVLWFSQSRTLNPTLEDWPVISNFNQSFTLLPYDWTSASPFEVKR